MNYIFLNATGQFLRWSQVSSHGGLCYHYQWVDDINQASLSRDTQFIFKLSWKSGKPIIIQLLPAEEIRTVKILKGDIS